MGCSCWRFSDAWNTRRTRAIVTTIIRICQLVVALIVVGIYAYDVGNGNMDKRWLYALAVSMLAVGVSVICLLARFCNRGHFSEVDVKGLLIRWISEIGMIVLWAIVCFFFGKLYIGNEAKTKPLAMLVATYLNFLNLVLWLTSFVMSLTIWLQTRKRGNQIGMSQAELDARMAPENNPSELTPEQYQAYADKMFWGK